MGDLKVLQTHVRTYLELLLLSSEAGDTKFCSRRYKAFVDLFCRAVRKEALSSCAVFSKVAATLFATDLRKQIPYV